MDKNQLEKNKGAVSCRVKVLTRIFQEGNLNLLNLLETRTKKNFVKEQTDYSTNLIKNDNKLTGRSTVHIEFTHAHALTIYLPYFLILQFLNLFQHFFSSVIYYKYLGPSHYILKENDHEVTTEITSFFCVNSSFSIIDHFLSSWCSRLLKRVR